jgi:RNA polymerase sigma-70 factor (ECF subfamily)
VRSEPAVSLKEMKAILERAIAKLPLSLRNVYLLREVEQLTTAETAACLALSEENVRVTLHRARTRLRALLGASAEAGEILRYPAPFCDPFTRRVMGIILAG